MDEETFNRLADNLAMNLNSEENLSQTTRILTSTAIVCALDIALGASGRKIQ